MLNLQRNSDARERWLAGVSLAAGVGLGAAIMYFCDPHRGKARRAEIRQRSAGAARQATRDLGAKIDDLLNRAKGLVAEAESALESPQTTVADDLIAKRVRSHLGHFTEHANAIETEVVNGVVALRGTVSPENKRGLINEILAVPGVTGVRDLLVAA